MNNCVVEMLNVCSSPQNCPMNQFLCCSVIHEQKKSECALVHSVEVKIENETNEWTVCTVEDTHNGKSQHNSGHPLRGCRS